MCSCGKSLLRRQLIKWNGREFRVCESTTSMVQSAAPAWKARCEDCEAQGMPRDDTEDKGRGRNELQQRYKSWPPWAERRSRPYYDALNLLVGVDTQSGEVSGIVPERTKNTPYYLLSMKNAMAHPFCCGGGLHRCKRHANMPTFLTSVRLLPNRNGTYAVRAGKR